MNPMHPCPVLRPNLFAQRRATQVATAALMGWFAWAAPFSTHAQVGSAPVLASTWVAKPAASAPLTEAAVPLASTVPTPALGASAAAPAGLKRRPVLMPSSTASDEWRIVEDDGVRIEETRSNGQLRRVSVAPKGRDVPRYAIVVGDDQRGTSQPQGAVGQRVWALFDF